MKAYGYCRVSTLTQADNGESLETQQQRITAFAQVIGVKLDSITIERGISGGIPLSDRPQGKKLLYILQSGDAIIATKLDRMFRSALDALTICELFQKKGVKLYLLDLGHDDVAGNGVSKMFLTMAAAFAEFERGRIKERVREGKRNGKEKGRYMGGYVPFGYSLNEETGEVKELPERKNLMMQMKRMKTQGKSLRVIADYFTGRGYKVTHQAVKNLLAE